ncbi:MAG: TlpA disulfide reductase family protein [Candidatus Thermoplasmatota archaeon]
MRGVVALVALFSLFSGCIAGGTQPAEDAQSPAAATQAAQSAPTHRVTCKLQDENKTPLTAGSCGFSFGGTLTVLDVDGEGSASLLVEPGSTGSLSGSAPGRVAANSGEFTVGKNVVVRITLPLSADDAKSAAESEADGASSGNTTKEATEEVEEATIYFEPVRDLLLTETYAVAPLTPEPVFINTFEVAAGYDRLEVVGKYDAVGLCLYLASTTITLNGPSGEVARYNSIDVCGVATGVGNGSGQSFPIGITDDAEPGTYTLKVSGAGLPTLTLEVYGLAGGAPDFSFTNFADGTVLYPRDFIGQVIIVDMMAAWCGPCNDAMPGLAAIRDDYEGKVEILSIDIDEGEPEADLRDFIARHNVDWPIGYEIGNSADDAYATGWIPTMVLIDQRGGLLYRSIGAIADGELRALIDETLEGA